jgi:asparagine synthase (glutamine-hydrolysing)
VALSGDGADEVFAGYRRYRHGTVEERIRRALPARGRQWSGTMARYYPKFDYLPQIFRAQTFLGNLALPLGDAYFTSMSTFRDAGLRTVLAPELAGALNGYSPREAFVDRFHRVRHLAPLEQLQAVDMETYLPGDILVKADRATMAYSLEARCPWLDYRLVELGCRMPPSFKLARGVGKLIFKHAVSRYVPKPVLNRRKMGFSPPLAAWFRGELRPVFEATVLDREMEAYLFFPEVRRIWEEHQGGMHNHDRKLWNLLMLAGWRARHRPQN